MDILERFWAWLAQAIRDLPDAIRGLGTDTPAVDFARVLLTDGFILIWCFLILGYLVVCFVWLAKGVIPLWISLRRAATHINRLDGEKGFAEGFNAYNDRIGRYRQIGHIWREFEESLIRPAPGAEVIILNTVEPSYFLNDETIIASSVQVRFFSSVPSHLTAAGILGTFVGLAAGVGVASQNLTGNTQELINKALRDLLSGASLAFITSIVGISSSLFFLVIERFSISRLHRALERWVSALEMRLRLVTPEKVALDHLVQAERQTAQLERFNDQLVFSIEKALDERIAGRIVPQLEQVVAAIEGLRSDRADSGTKVIEDMVGEFSRSLTQRAGAEFDAMSSTLASLNDTLGDALSRTEASHRELRVVMEEAQEQLRTSVSEGASSAQRELRAALQEAARTTQAAMDEASMKLAEGGQQAAERIAQSLGGFESSVERLERTTDVSSSMAANLERTLGQLDSLGDTLARAHAQFEGAARPIASASESLRQSSDKIAQALSDCSAVAQGIATHAAMIERQIEVMGSAWGDYETRFANVDESLRAAFEQMDQGLSRYTEQVKTFAQQLDRHTGESLQNLAAAGGELRQVIEALLVSLPGPRA
jgi:ABC-type transporter Mla subunit MlaD